MGGKTYNAVLGILQIELQRLNGRLFFSSFLILAVGCSSLFLSRLVGLVVDSLLLLRHLETFVGIDIKEHQEIVVLPSVSAVVLEASAVACEQHGLSTENPVRVRVVVRTIGQIVGFLFTRGINQRNIIVVVAAISVVGGQQPTAVGTPLKVDVAIRV